MYVLKHLPTYHQIIKLVSIYIIVYAITFLDSDISIDYSSIETVLSNTYPLLNLNILHLALCKLVWNSIS